MGLTKHLARGFLALAFGSIAPALAQTGTSPGAPQAGALAAEKPAPQPPAYKSGRADEDYSYLKDQSLRTDFWDPVKYIPFNEAGDVYLSLGAELRERYEYVSNPNFGLPFGRTDFLLHRLLLHGDLHVTEYARGFVQLGSHFQADRDTPRIATDDNSIDLHQGFLDLSLPLAALGSVTARGGRMELAFGSGRLISTRDSDNIRRAFDGGRAFWRLGPVRVDAIYGRPVLNRSAQFDDETSNREALWGVYGTATKIFSDSLNADVYWIGYDIDGARFPLEMPIGTGNERRHTYGGRLFGKGMGFDWDLEGAWQTGRFAATEIDIDAFLVGADFGYTFAECFLRPRLSVKGNIASGDDAAGDGEIGTFNPLFSKRPYFNEAGLIKPANIIDVSPTVTLNPMEKMLVTGSWDFLWRHHTNDGLYTRSSPLAALAGSTGGNSFIGHQGVLDFSWQATRHVGVKSSYVHFFAADTIEQAKGQDVDFFAVWGTYMF
jgi:hypothetical protein